MNVAHEEMTPHTVLMAVLLCSHHTSHFSFGFIRVPSLHWNSRAKSTLIDNVPVTWYLPGLCGSVKQMMGPYLGVPAPHRAKLTTHNSQKTIIRVNPENEGSSPFGYSCPPNCGTRQTIAPDSRCRQCIGSWFENDEQPHFKQEKNAGSTFCPMHKTKNQ